VLLEQDISGKVVIYQDQINKIKTVLVAHSDWMAHSPEAYVTRVMANFGSLKTIRIYLTHRYPFGRGKSDEEVCERANRVRAEFAVACSRHPEWKLRKFEIIDWKGRFY
jgi:hypothetical protein